MIPFSTRFQVDKKFFSCPPDPATIFFAGKTAVNCEANSYSIHSLSTFRDLIGQEDNIFRFLVDTQGKLWFALENRPPNTVPKHFQMTGDPFESACCFTAGNIKFKTKKGGVFLKNINHRSGDFYPSFLSLRWVLAILLVNEELLPFKLPTFIVLKEIKNEKIHKYIWRLKKVKKWVNSFRHNETLINVLGQQNIGSKLVHYQAVRSLPQEGVSLRAELELA